MKPSDQQPHGIIRSLLLAGFVVFGPLSPGIPLGPPNASAQGAQGPSRSLQGHVLSRRDLSVSFSGPAADRQAFAARLGRPLALAAGDLDEDGVPDLIAGYDAVGVGILSVHLGNADAIYPNSPEARERRALGRFTDSPFLTP